MTAASTAAAQILLVEDNPDDVELTVEAFRECGLTHALHVVDDGHAALAFLHREGTFAGAPRPDLILLDLNLPRRSGHEVLAAIKADPVLRAIPVLILTSSGAESDVKRAHELAADGYLKKAADLDGFFRVVAAIDRFWRNRQNAGEVRE